MHPSAHPAVLRFLCRYRVGGGISPAGRIWETTMNKRVLIVDDDVSTCQLLAEVLAEFDVETIAASTDEDGYRRYLELGPDLIFIDVLLPRKGGIDLLRRIRSVRGGRDVPVFVMSAV